MVGVIWFLFFLMVNFILFKNDWIDDLKRNLVLFECGGVDCY